MAQKIIGIFVFLLVLCRGGFAVAQNTVITDDCYEKILEKHGLTDKDVRNCKNAFRAIEDGNFKEAEQLAAEVENNALAGHLLAQKYLSNKYKANYQELKSWLLKYSDHPQGHRIYQLALKKGDEEGLTIPSAVNGSRQRFFTPYSWYNEDYENLKPKNGKYLRKKVNEFRKYINNGKTRMAKGVLEDPTFRQRIPNKNYDAMSATLALAYLMDNYDSLAIAWSEKAVKRSSDAIAAWIAGLAHYRQKNYQEAAKYFSILSDLKDDDEWLVSGGGYWASRSYEKLLKSKESEKYLIKAANYPRTFYGILANAKLGKEVEYNWSGKSYLNDLDDDKYVEQILSSPSIMRAVLLLKSKQKELAALELKADYPNMTPEQQELAVYITEQYDMHSLGITLSKSLRKTGLDVYYDHIAYPAPNWKPQSGWKVDQALVWALVRQESAFSPEARSGAGAKGLMQLMPGTAYHITKDKKIKKNQAPLFEIEYNLETGQNYVNYLLEKPFIEGNLFFLAAAYNAGPGNLMKWQKKMKYDGDPLLFIEVIPSRETRLYVKRVMTNYWIYNARFDKPNPSLDDVLNGRWPLVHK